MEKEEPGAHLGVIGGERERRSSAPGSLIVCRFGIAPTDTKNIPRSPHFVKVLEQKIGVRCPDTHYIRYNQALLGGKCCGYDKFFRL
jgi:hypothetical protein